jgi:ComF family protein
MDIKNAIARLGQELIDLAFPRRCILCGAFGLFLCRSCMQKLPTADIQKCVKCTKTSPFGKTHSDCLSKKCLDGLVSAMPYKNPAVKTVIEVFKYKFVEGLSDDLSRIMYDKICNYELLEFFKDFTITPVPLHKTRHRWRGFNQSALLAFSLNKKLKTEYDPDLVVRIKNTRPQVELNAEQRKENIKGAFTVTKKSPNKKVLLVDDVITTGSTLNELSRVLKKSGVTEVWSLTLACD